MFCVWNTLAFKTNSRNIILIIKLTFTDFVTWRLN